MIKTVEEVAQGYTITLSRGERQRNIHMLGFVDDKYHYVNSIPKQITKISITATETSVSLWNEV